MIDEEAAQVVKRIFALCGGKGPSQIAALLEKEKVLNPTAYKQREGRKTPHQTPENEYRWHESTVAYPRIHGVHRLHGQFQDLHQLHLG